MIIIRRLNPEFLGFLELFILLQGLPRNKRCCTITSDAVPPIQKTYVPEAAPARKKAVYLKGYGTKESRNWAAPMLAFSLSPALGTG